MYIGVGHLRRAVTERTRFYPRFLSLTEFPLPPPDALTLLNIVKINRARIHKFPRFIAFFLTFFLSFLFPCATTVLKISFFLHPSPFFSSAQKRSCTRTRFARPNISKSLLSLLNKTNEEGKRLLTIVVPTCSRAFSRRFAAATSNVWSSVQGRGRDGTRGR